MVEQLQFWGPPIKVFSRFRSKYDYETCYSIARSCRTKSEFKATNASAYTVARKRKWLRDYGWFENGKKHPKKFTFEICETVARSCHTLKEFYKLHYGEWNASKRNGWLEQFSWLERDRHSEWTEEECRQEALKYKTKASFRENNAGAYVAARDRGWLADYCWLEDQTINLEYGRIYCVYKYEFVTPEGCAVYVGLTMRAAERDRRHREGDSAVYAYAANMGVDIPSMQILEDGLTQSEARMKEDEYRQQYVASGCLVLNRAPTGALVGSVGGMKRRWTRKACFEEARKYTTPNEFRLGNNGAYLAATRHKWMSDYGWFKNGRLRGSKYTQEYCLMIAKRYTTRHDFLSHDAVAYNVARTNGWLESYIWLTPTNSVPAEDVQRVLTFYREGHDMKAVARETGVSLYMVRQLILKMIPNEFRGYRRTVIDEAAVLADYAKGWKGTKAEFARMHNFPSTDSLSGFLAKRGIVWRVRKASSKQEMCHEIVQRRRVRAY